ncbi:uncharacterized protein NECHADRAFT_55948, partial [Fusarium vanettenii 77-13-4]
SFLDNICVRGPTIDYNKEKVALRIRHFVLEYLINLDKVLINIKLFSYIVIG